MTFFTKIFLLFSFSIVVAEDKPSPSHPNLLDIPTVAQLFFKAQAHSKATRQLKLKRKFNTMETGLRPVSTCLGSFEENEEFYIWYKV